MDGRTTFGLAPMEGVSELPFRLWLAQVSSPAFASTPFLRATESFPAELPLDYAPEVSRDWDVSYQLIPQIMASSPYDFIRSAQLLLPSADFVDLNCGCPSPNPIRGGAGSSLLKDPQHLKAFVQTLADQLPAASFSLKMRTGFHDNTRFDELIGVLAHLPLRQLTIHGRTREDRYDGSSRWDLIQLAAERLPFTVIGSGDILGLDSLAKIASAAPAVTRCMIGRGALRNPWIFSELRDARPVVITRSLLQDAIASFALLTELGLNHRIDRLEPLIRDGLWRRPAGSDGEAFRNFYQQLCLALFGRVQSFQELQLDRITLGRVKMIWNYLRSSLPEAYFEPSLLRSKCLGELLVGLTRLDPGNEPFVICHKPEGDWLYTSSRRK